MYVAMKNCYCGLVSQTCLQCVCVCERERDAIVNFAPFHYKTEKKSNKLMLFFSPNFLASKLKIQKLEL
jgi:hypothetical protein